MPEPKARAAGIAFFHDGRVFLGKRGPNGDAPGTWAFPGGKIEQGESAEQAARRELYEEMGVEYRGRLRKLGTTSDGFVTFGASMDHKSRPYVEHLWIRRVGDEHTDTGWFDFDKLPEPLHPGIKELATMPLIEGKSNKARSENVKKEIEAGKDPKQAAAIAYSVQRKAQHANDADPVRGALDALHKIAEDCMAYDRRRK